MEETEGKLVRVIEVNPVQIRCSECDDVIGKALEEIEVVCKDCFETMKDKRDSLEEDINKIREITGE